MSKPMRIGLASSLTTFATFAIVLFVSSGAVSTVTPVEHYRAAWQKVGDHFLYEDRLTDWDKKKSPPGTLKTFAESEDAIRALVKGLGDKYTYYMTAPSTAADNKHSERKNVVSHRVVGGTIGYIKIRTFSSKHTADEVEKALQALSSVDGFILDLRGNGGGKVWQSFRVFAMFQEKGLFKTGKGRWEGKPYSCKYELTATHLREKAGSDITEKLRPKHYSGGKPIVILVDGDTASASESLAGALRFHQKAELVGENTFGKGITQTTFDLAQRTSVQITYAYTYQPDGNCIHGKGMKPDHVVAPVKGKDAPFEEALSVLTAKLAGNGSTPVNNGTVPAKSENVPDKEDK